MSIHEEIEQYKKMIWSCVTQEQVDNMEVAIERKYGFVQEVLIIILSNQRVIIFSDSTVKSLIKK